MNESKEEIAAQLEHQQELFYNEGAMMRAQNRQPAHPGRILKNLYLSPLGISNTKLAETIGVSRKTISHIVNEHKSVTPEMALRLSRAFPNTSAEFWLNLQKNHDLWRAGQDANHLQNIQPLFKTVPA